MSVRWWGADTRRPAACALGVAAVAVGVSLTGWAADLPLLVTFGGLASATPLTAMIGLSLVVSAGLRLVSRHRGIRVVSLVLVLLAGAATATVLAEYLWSLGSGLETVVWPVEQGVTTSRRPSAQTALGYAFLVAAGLAATSRSARAARFTALAGLLGATVGVLGGVGQLVPLASLYSSSALGASDLAYPTAVILAAVGVADLVAVAPRVVETTWRSERARQALRGLIPASVAVPVLVAASWGLVHLDSEVSVLAPLTVITGVGVLVVQVWLTASRIARVDQQQVDFVEALPVGVLSLTGDRLGYTNPAFHAMLGDDPAWLAAEPPVATVFSGPLAELSAAIERVREGGNGTSAEATIIGLDGATRVLTVSGRRIPDPPDVWVGMVQDISTRARAERDLAAANATLRERLGEQADRLLRYRAVVESSPNAILTKDTDGVIADWNPAAELLYGHTAEEAIGQPVSLIIPPDRRAELPELLHRVRRGELIQDFETVRVAKGGHRIDVALTISPLRAPTGEVVGASTTARDLTMIREHEERFRVVADAAAAGLLIVNLDGRILLANAEAERQFGFTGLELDGMPVDRLMPGLVLDEPPGQVRPAGNERSAVRKDGTGFPVEVAMRPVHVSGHGAIVVSIVDTTERRRAQRELRDKNRELERSNRELEEFAYIASHDLQEPLRMMVNYTELLGERYRGELDERADRYIGFIVDGGRRMRQLIQDLLLYSRAGTRGNELVPTDLNDVLRGVVADLEQSIADAGGQVYVRDMPTVVVDRGQIGQVFQNLISNGLKFRSERPPRIEISSSRVEDSWEFAVTDNGIGIEHEYAEQIFQMFSRLHERGAYEGSGIGLAVVRRIVERHGGQVWCEPGAVEGTTFRFTVPANAPLSQEHLQDRDGDAGTGPPTQRTGSAIAGLPG